MKEVTKTAFICYFLAFAGIANSEPASSTVPLEGISKIHLLGGHNLVVRQGGDEQVTIFADSDYIDEVEARVKGDTLALGEKRKSTWGWFSRRDQHEVTFDVQVRDLAYIASRGSGSVRLHPFDSEGQLELNVQGSGTLKADLLRAERFKVSVSGSGTADLDRVEADNMIMRVSGSGDMKVLELYGSGTQPGPNNLPKVSAAVAGSGNISAGKGEAGAVEVSVSGSGDIDLANLPARRVEVKISGSGDVSVYAAEELEVSITGSGDVLYRGQPSRIDRSVRGSGDIRSIN
jgi:hypothetical protein